MIHQSDMDASQRLAFCRTGGREMSESREELDTCILGLMSQIDALAAQRDEGLAREAELRRTLEDQGAMIEAEQEMKATARKQRDKVTKLLVEAEKLLSAEPVAYIVKVGNRSEILEPDNDWLLKYRQHGYKATPLIASPGCADGEKS